MTVTNFLLSLTVKKIFEKDGSMYKHVKQEVVCALSNGDIAASSQSMMRTVTEQAAFLAHP